MKISTLISVNVDLRTVLGALLIPPDYRLVIRQAQTIRKLHFLIRMMLRTLSLYKSFRLLFLGHIQTKMAKAKSPHDHHTSKTEKDKKAIVENNPLDKKPPGPGMFLKDYFVATFDRWQNEMDIFEKVPSKW